MKRVKYISKLGRKTLVEEKNHSKVSNEANKFSLNARDQLSDADYEHFELTDGIEIKIDQLSKADDNDNKNRELDHSRWREREYRRLKREYFDYISICKG